MSIDSFILRVKGDEFGSKSAVIGRHDTKKTGMVLDRQYHADRLHGFVAGEVGQSGGHCWN